MICTITELQRAQRLKTKSLEIKTNNKEVNTINQSGQSRSLSSLPSGCDLTSIGQ